VKFNAHYDKLHRDESNSRIQKMLEMKKELHMPQIPSVKLSFHTPKSMKLNFSWKSPRRRTPGSSFDRWFNNKYVRRPTQVLNGSKNPMHTGNYLSPSIADPSPAFSTPSASSPPLSKPSFVSPNGTYPSDYCLNRQSSLSSLETIV